MSKKVTILVLIFTCLLVVTKVKGSYTKDSLLVLEVRDSALMAIIDSFVNFEKQCDYYSKELPFYISLNDFDSTVQIESYEYIVKSADLGCFKHSDHLFIVRGKFLDPNLFIKTDEKQEIEYWQPKTEYDPKTGVVIDAVEDDSYTIWWYRFANGKFTLKGRHTFCK